MRQQPALTSELQRRWVMQNLHPRRCQKGFAYEEVAVAMHEKHVVPAGGCRENPAAD